MRAGLKEGEGRGAAAISILGSAKDDCAHTPRLPLTEKKVLIERESHVCSDPPAEHDQKEDRKKIKEIKKDREDQKDKKEKERVHYL